MWQPIDAPEDETTIVVRGKVWHQEGSRPCLALLGAEESPPAAPAAPATSSNDKRAEDVETGEVNK